MNKAELIDAVANRSGLSRTDADAAISTMFDVVLETVSTSDERISVAGYIAFERVMRSARKGRNPQTGEPIDIPASHAVKITAGSKLKQAAKGR